MNSLIINEFIDNWIALSLLNFMNSLLFLCMNLVLTMVGPYNLYQGCRAFVSHSMACWGSPPWQAIKNSSHISNHLCPFLHVLPLIFLWKQDHPWDPPRMMHPLSWCQYQRPMPLQVHFPQQASWGVMTRKRQQWKWWQWKWWQWQPKMTAVAAATMAAAVATMAPATMVTNDGNECQWQTIGMSNGNEQLQWMKGDKWWWKMVKDDEWWQIMANDNNKWQRMMTMNCNDDW